MACPPLKIDMIYALLCKVIKQYPESECKQINSFGIQNDRGDHNSPNFNKSKDDYNNGHFFARKWVLEGAVKGDVCIDYPLGHVEHTKTIFNDLEKRDACAELWLGVSDIYECSTCPCHKTRQQVLIDTKEMLLQWLYELSAHVQYEIIDGDDVHYTWMTPAEYEQCVEDLQEEFDAINTTGKCLGDDIQIVNGSIGKWGRGVSANNVEGWAIQIRICGCVCEPEDFNYQKTEIKEIPTTVCATC